jgi:hypothetical protein
MLMHAVDERIGLNSDDATIVEDLSRSAPPVPGTTTHFSIAHPLKVALRCGVQIAAGYRDLLSQ